MDIAFEQHGYYLVLWVERWLVIAVYIPYSDELSRGIRMSCCSCAKCWLTAALEGNGSSRECVKEILPDVAWNVGN